MFVSICSREFYILPSTFKLEQRNKSLCWDTLIKETSNMSAENCKMPFLAVRCINPNEDATSKLQDAIFGGHMHQSE